MASPAPFLREILQLWNGSKPVPWKCDDNGSAVVAGAGPIKPSAPYGGNVEVDSITGTVIDTFATGATRCLLTVQKVTGAPGAMYIGFGEDDAAAIASVNATVGSELGTLAFALATPVVGTTYEFTIPAAARDGGKLAAGIADYANGTKELVVNISQGV